VKLTFYTSYPILLIIAKKKSNHFYPLTLFKAPASGARPGSSTRPISARPTRSPPSSRTALPLLSPPPSATSGCPALYGSERSKPACLGYWSRSGPNPHPALRGHARRQSARGLMGKRAGLVAADVECCGDHRQGHGDPNSPASTRFERPRPLVPAGRRPSSAMTSKRDSQSCSEPRKSQARDREMSRNLV
jgi:hypothetical protein